LGQSRIRASAITRGADDAVCKQDRTGELDDGVAIARQICSPGYFATLRAKSCHPHPSPLAIRSSRQVKTAAHKGRMKRSFQKSSIVFRHSFRIGADEIVLNRASLCLAQVVKSLGLQAKAGK
jgi:hypothetical protein